MIVAPICQSILARFSKFANLLIYLSYFTFSLSDFSSAGVTLSSAKSISGIVIDVAPDNGMIMLPMLQPSPSFSNSAVTIYNYDLNISRDALSTIVLGRKLNCFEKTVQAGKPIFRCQVEYSDSPPQSTVLYVGMIDEIAEGLNLDASKR